MKAFLWFVACLGMLAAPGAGAAGSVGFIQGNIWYSPDPFFAGETVRLYSAVFNGNSSDIVGTVEFYAQGVSVGTTSFKAAAGKLQEVWVDWLATFGDREISAKITRAAISRAGQPEQSIAVASSESGKSVRFIDKDSDGDRTGDRQDLDDDNDGVSDADEAARGTNPLAKDAAAPAQQSAAPSSQSLSVPKEIAPLVDSATVAAANVAETVDATADTFREPLLAKKAALEQEIAVLKQQENTFVQTEQGANINIATGDDTVAPSRPVSTPADTLKRIGKQLLLLAVIGALYLIDHKIILYIVLALIAYKLIRWVIRLFVARRASY